MVGYSKAFAAPCAEFVRAGLSVPMLQAPGTNAAAMHLMHVYHESPGPDGPFRLERNSLMTAANDGRLQG